MGALDIPNLGIYDLVWFQLPLALFGLACTVVTVEFLRVENVIDYSLSLPTQITSEMNGTFERQQIKYFSCNLVQRIKG